MSILTDEIQHWYWAMIQMSGHKEMCYIKALRLEFLTFVLHVLQLSMSTNFSHSQDWQF